MPAAPPITKIDPTPGLGDITSFEAAKAAKPEPPPVVKATPTPAPSTSEIHLDKPSDAEAMGKLPESTLNALDKIAKGLPPEEEAKSQETEDNKQEADNSKSDASDDSDEELEKQVQAFQTLKQVRQAHKEALKREREWRKHEMEYKTKLEQAETRLKSYDPEADEARKTELDSTKKERQELLERIRVLDYQQHPEFHDKFVKPLAKALERAYADISGMEIKNEDGTSRKATAEDFQTLAGMAPWKAGEAAEKLLGRWGAMQVMSHVQKVQELRTAQKEAVEQAGKLADEARQKQTLQQSQHSEALQKVFKQRGGELEEKFSDLFKARKGDDEGNALLDKGWKMVNALDAEDVAEEDKVRLAAETRYRAAAFGRLLLDIKRLQSERDALRKELKAFQKSEPKETDGGGKVPAEDANGDPLERAFRQMEKMARPVMA